MERKTSDAGSPPPAARAQPLATLLTGAWPTLPAIAVVVVVLLRLGFDEGGYFPGAFTSAGAIAFIVLAVLVLRRPQERFCTHALVAIGLLIAFACWTGLSRAWSTVPDVPLLDMQRAMLYVALFGLALLAADSARNARLLLWSVLAVIVVIVGAGLLSRLQPDVIFSPTDAATRPAYRLDHPLHYWNAFGALASIGAVLAIGLAAEARGNPILRAAAAGAAVLLTVTMYLALSRGAWLALILGIVVLAVIAPNRGSLLLALMIAGGAAAVAILRLQSYPALVLDPQAGSGQAAQGDAFTRELLVLTLLAAAAQGALAVVRVSSELERRARSMRRPALVAGGILVVAAATASYLAKGAEAERAVTAAVGDAPAWLDRQWQDFFDSGTSPGTGNARLFSARGARSDGYRVAVEGFKADPLIGGGAGSFEARYARDRERPVKVRDAHSLPLQTLSELGAIGMALLLGFLGVVATVARRALTGNGVLRRGEAAALSAAFAVWLGHACVDWDWEMPVLTATALALGASLFQRGRPSSMPSQTLGQS